MAATSTVTQASGHSHTATSTAMKYRSTNSGSPLSHQDVDDNFELLRQAVNGIIGDIDGVVDKDVLTNVPANAVFTDTTYSTATASTAGLVKIGYTESGKNYPVELSDGKMFVNVPWVDTNTTYSTATASTAGLVKIGYSENGRNYPVELSSGKMFVNVPWVDTNTDTNTTYSAGTGLTLSGTTFNLSKNPLSATTFEITGAYARPNGVTGTASYTASQFASAYPFLSSNNSSRFAGLDGGTARVDYISLFGRSDDDYTAIEVNNQAINARGAKFAARCMRHLDGNTSSTTREPYLATTIQCQTLINTGSYAPRQAWTYENFNAAHYTYSHAVATLHMNGGTMYGYSTFDMPQHVDSNGRMTLGSSSTPWKEIFAVSTTINTSDIRLKQDIEELSEAEKRVAVAAKGLLRKYRWRDAVEKKGDSARIHFGVMAQDLKAAFEAEGLDGFKYSVLCYDEWWLNPEDGSDSREEEVPGFIHKDQYSVRYEELFAFIISAL